MADHRKGDTIILLLDYTVDGTPLEEYNPDEIEFYLGIDSDTGKYMIFVTQSVTFALSNIVDYQMRVKKGTEVVSIPITKIAIGNTISTTVL